MPREDTRPARISRMAFAVVAAVLASAGIAARADDPVSTSGPTRPVKLEPRARRAAELKIMIDDPVVISNVPPYGWFHGCGPTSEGMVLGYWDGQGFGDLFSGSATSLSAEVQAGIASAEHVADYVMPDDLVGPVLPDASETNPAGCHANNCVADWMNTSRSVLNLNHGWSKWSDLPRGYTGYVAHVAPQYGISVEQKTWANLTWQSFCDQIDSNRPAIFLIDSNGDGGADHIVAAIGYGTQDGTNMYACYDTWYPYDEITWWPFTGVGAGKDFGIYGGVYLNLWHIDPPEKPINPSPTNGAGNVLINPTLSWEDGGGAWSYDVYFGTNAVPGTNDFQGSTLSTFFKPGTLQTRTVYYWRVDASNTAGLTTGDVWSFTTADLVIHYVAPNGGNVAPYTNWATAARTIFNGVRSAADGDWVIVSNGTYFETAAIMVTGTYVQIASVNGPDVTTVDMNEAGRRAFYITNGLVKGFTITRAGYGSFVGGAVYLSGAGRLENCRIQKSFSASRGGALYFNGGGMARNCLIVSNLCYYQGGGAYFNEGGIMENCTVVGNASYYSYVGGGVYLTNGGQIVNSIIEFNGTSAGSNYYNDGTGWGYTNTCTSPPVPGDGNIAADPKFKGFPSDLHLKSSSPCVNAGTNLDWMADAQDLDGNPRILDGCADMGAYERDPADIDVFTLTVESDYGNATPAPGTYTNDAGAILTNSVTTPDTQGSTQYVCTGWTMGGNDPAWGTSNSFTMAHTNNAALAWTWKTQYQFTRAAASGGSVTGDPDGWYDEGGSVTVTAVPDTGWQFDGWAGDVPETDTNNNPLTVTMNMARSVTGHFGVILRSLTIESAHGTCTPPVGLYFHGGGAVLTNSVAEPPPADGTQYVCTGWAMTGNDPVSGVTTSFVMTVTNDATLTWLWNTNVELDCTAGANGQVTGDPSGWYPQGASADVTAVPDPYYHFAGWSGDVAAGQTNNPSLSLSLDARCYITANFGESQPHDCGMSNGNMATLWDADPGCFYQLQGCSDLMNPAWSNVSQIVTATENTVTLVGTNCSAPNAAYRAMQVFP
ncbi:MAG: hypothetical protein JXB04_13640 [Kiritimatiellae bacterium]|nr:hypothetical protein [Kiritimatiellia bacterium]